MDSVLRQNNTGSALLSVVTQPVRDVLTEGVEGVVMERLVLCPHPGHWSFWPDKRYGVGSSGNEHAEKGGVIPAASVVWLKLTE